MFFCCGALLHLLPVTLDLLLTIAAAAAAEEPYPTL
jgi:hypothetical protein